MGYYTTPEDSLYYIKKLIKIDFKCKERQFHLLDPCCGEGEALRQVSYWANYDDNSRTSNYDNELITWGIELDIDRANSAVNNIDNIIQCSIFDARLNPLGSTGLLYLNPPYNTDEGQRVEMKFLKHSIKWLCSGGVLVFIIPEHVLGKEDNRNWIGQHFRKILITRLHRNDYPVFKQVVLFGLKREDRVEEGDLIPPPYSEHIEDLRIKPFIIPPTEGPKVFQGSDAVTEEDIRQNRPKLIEEIKKIIGEQKAIAGLRPLFPLRRGHLVSLVTAGVLDGKIETPGGGFIVIKGFSERSEDTRIEDNVEITRNTYSVDIRVIEEGGRWYDIR
jgi:hypothetical protein